MAVHATMRRHNSVKWLDGECGGHREMTRLGWLEATSTPPGGGRSGMAQRLAER